MYDVTYSVKSSTVKYRISLNNVRGNQQKKSNFKSANTYLNNVPFLCTKLLQKGDTVQGGTLFKEIRYLQNL